MGPRVERSVEVDREELLQILIENKEKHVKEFNEAMSVYKETLARKVEGSYIQAQVKLKKRFDALNKELEEWTDEEIQEQSDQILFLSSIMIDMPVPRSYADEYDVAIDIARWDTNDTLKLSATEFACFVRDQWDWTNNFKAISALYNN